MLVAIEVSECPQIEKTVAALAACTLTFAACGDDDENPSGGTGAETETTEADVETTEAEEPESTREAPSFATCALV